jgi:hypothetical protein
MFYYIAEHIDTNENVVADALSRKSYAIRERQISKSIQIGASVFQIAIFPR